MSNDFFEIARGQRAHRAFRDEPVDDAVIEQLLETATRAPSAENRQPWEFVVVRESMTRRAIGDLMERAWDRGGRAFSESRLPTAMLDAVDHGMRGGVAGAPVLVVVCADLDRGMEVTVGSSLFPAIQNILLGATALGLGSALTTIATSFDTELRSLLGLPDHVRAVAVIPLGWPAKMLGPSRRDPVADHTHRERYGQRW